MNPLKDRLIPLYNLSNCNAWKFIKALLTWISCWDECVDVDVHLPLGVAAGSRNVSCSNSWTAGP